MQLPAAKASLSVCLSVCRSGQSQRSKTQKILTPNASSPWQRVSNGYLCHPLPVLNVAFWPDRKSKKNAAPRGQSLSVCLSICLSVCLRSGQSQRSKTQKKLAPNASSPWQRVSNGYLCHPLPVPNVAFWPDRKIKKNATPRGQSQSVCLSIFLSVCRSGQSQRSKTQKMLAPNASSPWQRVSNGYLCHPLPVPNVAFWPDRKIKKNAAPRGQSQSVCLFVCLSICLSGQSQRSKTQKMLAPNASSPWQRVSNGYLCHPLPVPNVAFWPDRKIKKKATPRRQRKSVSLSVCLSVSLSGPRPKPQPKPAVQDPKNAGS